MGGDAPPAPVESVGAGAGSALCGAGAGAVGCAVGGRIRLGGRGVAVWHRGRQLLGRRIDAGGAGGRGRCRPRAGRRHRRHRARGQAAGGGASGQPHVDVARRPRPRGRRARGSRRSTWPAARVAVPKISSGPSRICDDDAVRRAGLDQLEPRPQRRGRGAGDARRVERGRVGQAVAVRRRRRSRSSAGCPRPGCRAGSCRRPPPAARRRSAAGRYSITWIASPCGKSGRTSSALTTG